MVGRFWRADRHFGVRAPAAPGAPPSPDQLVEKTAETVEAANQARQAMAAVQEVIDQANRMNNGTPGQNQEAAVDAGLQSHANVTLDRLLATVYERLQQGYTHLSIAGERLETPEAILRALRTDGRIFVGGEVTLPELGGPRC